jgi:hypothetical protein
LSHRDTVASTIDSPSGGTFMESIQTDPERMEIKIGIFVMHAAHTFRLNITLP